MKNRSDAAIEKRVVGMAVLNDADAGKEELTGRQAFADDAGDHGQIAEMDAVVGFGQVLERVIEAAADSAGLVTRRILASSV